MMYKGILKAGSALFILLALSYGGPLFGQGHQGHQGAPMGDRGQLGPAMQEALKAAGISPQFAPQRIEKGNVSVEFTLAPLSEEAKGGTLLESSEVRLIFQAMDVSTKKPLAGKEFMAWVDLRKPSDSSDEDNCKRKIAGFVSGQLQQKPTIDLNSYYLFVLHDDNTVSVIDPLTKVGMTSALAAMSLRGTGADFVLSRDSSYLYVSMPYVNQVAVIDTLKMRILRNLDVGKEPTRLALSPDGKYLWVSNQGSGDVSVIETRSNTVKGTIKVGPGPHWFAFDNENAYVMSQAGLPAPTKVGEQAGRLTLIKLTSLAKIKEIKVGKKLTGLAYSSASKAVYITDDEPGLLHIYQPAKGRLAKAIKLSSGISYIRFSPDGRWGFILNSKKNAASILDASGRIKVRTIQTGKGPDQVAFTHSYAYIRNTGTEMVTLVGLDSLNHPDNINLADVTMFQLPPDAEGGKELGLANAIAPVPTGHGAVMVSNPAESTIYYYMEGMNAPMGTMRGMIRKAKGVLALDRSLKEVEPGIFTVPVRLKDAGVYDVPFLMRESRTFGCFQMEVRTKAGELRAKAARLPIQAESMASSSPLRPKEAIIIRFRITNPEDGRPLDNLQDVRMMAFRMPGNWRQVREARPVGNGLYEASFVFPEEGSYYVLVEAPSKGVKFGDIRHVVINVKEGGASSLPSK